MCRQTFLIIGEGTFGLSTAWHLLEAEEGANIVVIDNGCSLAPSRDISKFVRIDYPNPRRSAEAAEARRLWQTHKLFAPYFHCTGRVVSYSQEHGTTLAQINQTRLSLGLPEREIRDGGLTLNSICMPVGYQWVHNHDDGIVRWDAVMQAVKEDCIQRHATFHSVHVDHLVKRDRAIIGIVTKTGYISTMHMEVILAAGPWITSLLDMSAIERPPTPHTLTATGIFALFLHLNQQQQEAYRRLPPYSEIGKAEFVCHPVHPENAKITWVRPFTAPKPRDVSNTDLAILTLLEARLWARSRLPLLVGAHIVSVRSYWDGVTPNQQPLIARHPDFRNLIVAGGGSYTHAKDLPLIGRIAADLALHPEPCNCRGWMQEDPGEHHNQPALSTTTTFAELEIEASKDPRVLQWKSKTVGCQAAEWII